MKTRGARAIDPQFVARHKRTLDRARGCRSEANRNETCESSDTTDCGTGRINRSRLFRYRYRLCFGKCEPGPARACRAQILSHVAGWAYLGTLALVFCDVTTSIALFVSFEVRAIDTLCLFRFFTGFWHWALVAVGGMEMVIYMAPEVGRAMKPWAGANEDAAIEPLWTVVAGRSTGVRSDVIVSVRTIGGDSDFDVNPEPPP